MGERWSLSNLGKLFQRKGNSEPVVPVVETRDSAEIVKIDQVLDQLLALVEADFDPQLRTAVQAEVAAKIAQTKADLSYLENHGQEWNTAFYLGLAKERPHLLKFRIIDQVEGRIDDLKEVLSRQAINASPDLTEQKQNIEDGIFSCLKDVKEAQIKLIAPLERLSSEGIDLLLYADKIQQIAEFLGKNADDQYTKIFTGRKTLYELSIIYVLRDLATQIKEILTREFIDSEQSSQQINWQIDKIKSLIAERLIAVPEYQGTTTGHYYRGLNRVMEKLFLSLNQAMTKFAELPPDGQSSNTAS